MKQSLRTIASIVCLAALSWLAGCSSMYGPRVVPVPLDKLQAGIERRLPLRQRYLNLVDVTISNPHLSLQPESNRIVVAVDTAIEPLFVRPLNGTIMISGVLAIDADRHAVVLREPHMDQLSVVGMDPSLSAQLAKIGDSLAAKLLAETPLYVFDSARFKYAGVQFLPTSINTTSQALMVTFEPVR